MEIIKASPSEHRELANFARHTYKCAFGNEIELSVLNQHLTEKMCDDCFKQILSIDDVYLALSDNQIVGFAQLGKVDSAYAEYIESFDNTGSELRRLYVKPELQSRGIGSKLMEKTINAVCQKSARNIYLTTWESNFGALKFYGEHGFSRVGQFPEYDTNGYPNGFELIMLREL